MPTYRNIDVSLLSQYDAHKMPEFPPPLQPTASNAQAALLQGSSIVHLLHPTLPIVSVYIPTYPASTFWLSYCINTSSSTLDNSPAAPFYYFKLFVNGTHFVSWGCGADDEFKGKMMFAIFRSQDGIGVLERRVLTFGEEENEEGIIELRVYRAKARGRVRIEQGTVPQLGGIEGAAEASSDTGNIVLNNTGALPFRHPKRFYNYFLLDAVDEPHVTFRFLYRSWDALNLLGIPAPDSSNIVSRRSSGSSSSSKDPDLSAKELRLREASRKVNEDSILNTQDAVSRSVAEHYDSRTKPLPPTPTSSPRSQSETGGIQDPQGLSRPRPSSAPEKTHEKLIEKPSRDPRMDKIVFRANSLINLARPTHNHQADIPISQPKPIITSQEPAHNPQPDDTSPRPKRVSSLLGPPKLFPGALYPTPPTSLTYRPDPSPHVLPTKASFSNTVSLLVAPARQETSDLSTLPESQAPANPASKSRERAKSPSKFKIAEFLVRRDDDSKGSRHSVGKRKTGQRPTNPGNVNVVSEFGKVGTGLDKASHPDIGVGKENEVLEGVGTMPRGGNLWKERIRLKGKRKKAGKMIALAESSEEGSRRVA